MHGHVTTANDPLPGVAVVIKNSNKGTITDIDGNYALKNINAGSYTLLISFMGYKAQEKPLEIKAGSNQEINISLEEETLEMDELEIVGKSITQEVTEQAYSISTISTKNLQNTTADAKDVLNRLPGVRVLEEGGLGSSLSFSLNGFSGDQVKFFLDGIPMNNFGSSLSLSSIPVNAIERIEVYKGVVPVWLGTDALGGAINIITKQNSNFLDASYSFGSFNTHRVSINGAHTNKKTGFTARGSLIYNYSDNDYEVNVPITDANGNVLYRTNTKRFHDAYESATAKIEAGVVNKKYADQLLLGVIVSGDDKEIQNGAIMAQPFGAITRDSKSIIPTLKYNKENIFIPKLNLSLNSSFNFTETNNIDTLSGVYYNWLGETIPRGQPAENGQANDLEFKIREFTNQLNLGYAITNKHSLALNYAFQNYHRESYDYEHPNDPSNDLPGILNKHVLGMAYKFQPNKKWSTTLFGKGYFLNLETNQQSTSTGNEETTSIYKASSETFGYGLATSYFLLPQLQLKASYEKSYRLPSANEVFGDGNFVSANSDLQPEESSNLNVGANLGLHIGKDHHITVESNFVYRNADNLIYQVVTVSSPETNYSNLAKIRTLGVEGSIDYQWKNLLNLGASITYQNITDQADRVYNDYSGWQTNFNKGYRLPNTPYLFGNARAVFTPSALLDMNNTLRISYFYNFNKEYFLSWAKYGSADSKTVIPAQSSHNVELAYSLKDETYNISLECRNLTDARLYDKYYLQKPGRAFYIKLRYAIGR
ncbi:TonB-dependent receptor [Fulvivirga maritima]|nr:TonB-dependent receptor [Fulvivirga maritima]